MSSYKVLDGAGDLKYVKTIGDGSVSNSYKMIHYTHTEAEISDGVMFMASGIFAIGNGNTLKFLIRVPVNRYVEIMAMEITTEDAPIKIHMHEDCSYSDVGTAVNLINFNRNSSNTAQTSLYSGPTITSDGTLIYQTLLTGDKSIGGHVSREGRMILKMNTNYLLEIENVSGANTNVSIYLMLEDEDG